MRALLTLVLAVGALGACASSKPTVSEWMAMGCSPRFYSKCIRTSEELKVAERENNTAIAALRNSPPPKDNWSIVSEALDEVSTTQTNQRQLDFQRVMAADVERERAAKARQRQADNLAAEAKRRQADDRAAKAARQRAAEVNARRVSVASDNGQFDEGTTLYADGTERPGRHFNSGSNFCNPHMLNNAHPLRHKPSSYFWRAGHPKPECNSNLITIPHPTKSGAGTSK